MVVETGIDADAGAANDAGSTTDSAGREPLIACAGDP
jgi:hypothetical protein